jgi:hypothetical protein
MKKIFYFIQQIFFPQNNVQKIGLCHINDVSLPKKNREPSLKSKDIKLSDLMRRVS